PAHGREPSRRWLLRRPRLPRVGRVHAPLLLGLPRAAGGHGFDVAAGLTPRRPVCAAGERVCTHARAPAHHVPGALFCAFARSRLASDVSWPAVGRPWSLLTCSAAARA